LGSVTQNIMIIPINAPRITNLLTHVDVLREMIRRLGEVKKCMVYEVECKTLDQNKPSERLWKKTVGRDI